MVREGIVRSRCIEMPWTRRNGERSVGHYFDSGNAFLQCFFALCPRDVLLPAGARQEARLQIKFMSNFS
jgi:hypothetical protein